MGHPGTWTVTNSPASSKAERRASWDRVPWDRHAGSSGRRGVGAGAQGRRPGASGLRQGRGSGCPTERVRHEPGKREKRTVEDKGTPDDAGPPRALDPPSSSMTLSVFGQRRCRAGSCVSVCKRLPTAVPAAPPHLCRLLGRGAGAHSGLGTPTPQAISAHLGSKPEGLLEGYRSALGTSPFWPHVGGPNPSDPPCPHPTCKQRMSPGRAPSSAPPCVSLFSWTSFALTAAAQ